jgi:hypothetical protein
MQAIEHVTKTFEGLSLDGRLAFIGPDEDFVFGLKGPLQAQLDETYVRQGSNVPRFRLITATEAGAACSSEIGNMESGGNGDEPTELLTMDFMANMDGLEWLIVVCVGLEQPGDAYAGEYILKTNTLYSGFRV